jgi:hypothetical protein
MINNVYKDEKGYIRIAESSELEEEYKKKYELIGEEDTEKHFVMLYGR